MSALASRVSQGAAAHLPQLTRGQQRGAMLVLALGTGYTLLRQRLVPRWVMQKWFLLSATALIIPSSALLYLIDPLRYLGVPRRWVQSVCVFVLGSVFKAVWYANPQIKMEVAFDGNVDGKPLSWSDVPTTGIAITMNHTSFWDVFEMIGITPISHLMKMRTLMKSSLRKIPIFGGVFDRVGHFPVYFKSNEDGNFHVDKERQAEVSRHVNWHLRHGGNIVVFPEGAINKKPETLQTFRFGTFATIFEHRMPVYYMVAVGNEKTWAPSMPYGGLPATIRIRIGAYPIDFDKDDSKSVAVGLQQRMQQVRDEIAAQIAAEEAAAQRRKGKSPEEAGKAGAAAAAAAAAAAPTPALA